MAAALLAAGCCHGGLIHRLLAAGCRLEGIPMLSGSPSATSGNSPRRNLRANRSQRDSDMNLGPVAQQATAALPRAVLASLPDGCGYRMP
jgi:hypothetical protein